MPGNDFVIRTNHADERAGLFLIRQAQRMIQRSVRGILESVYNCIFNHISTYQRPSRADCFRPYRTKFAKKCFTLSTSVPATFRCITSFYLSLLLENNFVFIQAIMKDREVSCNVRLPTCRWIQLGILFTSLFVLKRRRVRQVATNNTVLSAGSVQVVHDQGQVLFLWIRCRAIRRFIQCGAPQQDPSSPPHPRGSNR